jgi:hypothetical protein
MSDLLIVLMLLAPIFIVVVILNYASRKRRKNDRAKVLEYIVAVARRTGVACDHHHQLVHQTVIIDEKSRKLLIIDHARAVFSYDEYSLDEIREVKVEHHKQVFMQEDKGKRQEHITTTIGLELIVGKSRENKFLTVYDYAAHSIYQMKDFENEALVLKTRIEKAGRGESVVI